MAAGVVGSVEGVISEQQRAAASTIPPRGDDAWEMCNRDECVRHARVSLSIVGRKRREIGERRDRLRRLHTRTHRDCDLD